MRESDLFDPLVWSDSLDIMPTHQLTATASSCTVRLSFIKYDVSLQLSSCSVQVCLSMGYLVRSMLQATVVVILKKTKILLLLLKGSSMKEDTYSTCYFCSRFYHSGCNSYQMLIQTNNKAHLWISSLLSGWSCAHVSNWLAWYLLHIKIKHELRMKSSLCIAVMM